MAMGYDDYAALSALVLESKCIPVDMLLKQTDRSAMMLVGFVFTNN